MRARGSFGASSSAACESYVLAFFAGECASVSNYEIVARETPARTRLGTQVRAG